MVCSTWEDSLIFHVQLLRATLVWDLNWLLWIWVSSVRMTTLWNELGCLHVPKLSADHQVVGLGCCRSLFVAQSSVYSVVRVRQWPNYTYISIKDIILVAGLEKFVVKMGSLVLIVRCNASSLDRAIDQWTVSTYYYSARLFSGLVSLEEVFPLLEFKGYAALSA